MADPTCRRRRTHTWLRLCWHRGLDIQPRRWKAYRGLERRAMGDGGSELIDQGFDVVY